jgi:diaminohydroxyphosphoribosylaminopyrimidine deaminase/5-amino-6-(5-phosphoribosylamino)uracil reductase
LFDKTAKTIVLNNQKGEEGEAANFYKLAAGDNGVEPVCNALFDLDVQSVLVEGGAALLQSFINEGTWDEARIITNNQLLIGEGLAAPQLKNAALISEEQVQSDTISFYVKVN